MLAVRFELRPPGRMQRVPAPADAGLEMLAYPVGHEERGVFWPAVPALGQPDLFLAQWLAMGRTGVLLVGRTVGDMAVDHDQGRPIGGVCERGEGTFEHRQIVGVTHRASRSSHSR